MIYTRHGNKVEVVKNHGEHQPDNFVAPVTLVEVKDLETGEFFCQFAEFLRFDSSYSEVFNQWSSLPVTELTGEILKKALHEAS